MIAFFNHLKQQPPHVLYHYTSQPGLLGIIETCRIWASKLQYLNDSREHTVARDLIMSYLTSRKIEAEGAPANFNERLKQSARLLDELNVYACSFSAEGDLLSQWRGYCADGAGYAIGWKSSTLQRIAMNQGLILAPCLYAPNDQALIIDEIFATNLGIFNSGTVPNANIDDLAWWFWQMMLMVSPLFKDSSFEEEREWRLIAPHYRSFPCRTKTRAGRWMPVPYIEIALDLPDASVELARINVGPTPFPMLACAAVNAALKASRVSCSTVERSKTPYRGW